MKFEENIDMNKKLLFGGEREWLLNERNESNISKKGQERK